MSANWMTMEVASRPENVGVVRLAVATFAGALGFTLGELEELKVAVSEAVSNAVLHGYGDTSGTVRVEVGNPDGVLELVVGDEGKGIADVAQARKPSFSTDPERMGLGFVFMESFSDTLEVESEPGKGTRVRMRKRPSGTA